MVQSVIELYQQVLGRNPTAQELTHWSATFGREIDSSEVDRFKSAAQAELGARPAGFSAPASFEQVPTIRNYQGIEHDWNTVQKLAQQIASSYNPQVSTGGVFSTSGASVGFDYDALKSSLGREATPQEQVIYDMAGQLIQQGITDISQLKPGAVPTPSYGEGGFGATYTGSGGTSYKVEFDPATGKPVFYTQGFENSDRDKILGALAIGGLLFGGASLLGGLGSSAGAGAAGAGAAGAGAAGAGLTGAELAIALGEGLVPIASTAGQAGIVGANLGALGAGIGLGGAAAGGAGALTGIDAMIAAGEGMVPITAEQVATAGLSSSELGALGSGIGLGGTPGMLSQVGEYLKKNPNAIRSLLNLAMSSGQLTGGGGPEGVGSIPTQGIPVNTPEYYQAIQRYYDAYLPNTNPNVSQSLAAWYNSTPQS